MTVAAVPRSLRVAGSAAPRVVALANRPAAPAQVVHSGREAVYLAVDGTCVGVLSSGAVLVPCGIRTSLPELPLHLVGDEVLLGDGAVELPGARVEVVGTVGTGVDRMTPDGVLSARARVAELAPAPQLDAVHAALPAAALRDLVAGDPASVPPLMGRGPGLTPLGDDVLCGWLVTALAMSSPALEAIRDQVMASATVRTTLLSATLLECAGRGEALPQVRDLLASLADGEAGRSERSLERLLGVGGTSGAGLALGCLAALDALPGTRAEGHR